MRIYRFCNFLSENLSEHQSRIASSIIDHRLPSWKEKIMQLRDLFIDLEDEYDLKVGVSINLLYPSHGIHRTCVMFKCTNFDITFQDPNVTGSDVFTNGWYYYSISIRPIPNIDGYSNGEFPSMASNTTKKLCDRIIQMSSQVESTMDLKELSVGDVKHHFSIGDVARNSNYSLQFSYHKDLPTEKHMVLTSASLVFYDQNGSDKYLSSGK